MITNDQLGDAIGADLPTGEPSIDGANEVCTFRRDGGAPIVVTVFGANGDAALAKAERSPDRVQLVVSDRYAVVIESSTLWLEQDGTVVRIALEDGTTMPTMSSIAKAVTLPGST